MSKQLKSNTCNVHVNLTSILASLRPKLWYKVMHGKNLNAKSNCKRKIFNISSVKSKRFSFLTPFYFLSKTFTDYISNERHVLSLKKNTEAEDIST